jgi:hypothetical protein
MCDEFSMRISSSSPVPLMIDGIVMERMRDVPRPLSLLVSVVTGVELACGLLDDLMALGGLTGTPDGVMDDVDGPAVVVAVPACPAVPVPNAAAAAIADVEATAPPAPPGPCPPLPPGAGTNTTLLVPPLLLPPSVAVLVVTDLSSRRSSWR